MITLLSNICPVSKRSRQWRFSEILRRQLFARITLPWFMSVEREKCPSFLSTAPFPAPVLFLQPLTLPFSSLSSSQPTVFSRYPQFTTRIADSCRLASRSGINPRVSIPYRATKYANSMPVPSLLFIFLAFTRQLFRASSLELHGFMTSV